MKKSYAVKVPLKDAEKIKVILNKHRLIDKNLKIKKDTIYLYFPITKKDTLLILKNNIIKEDFEEVEKKIRSYKENLDLPADLKKLLPTSYDIIGNIALVKLQDELIKHKKYIGEEILKSKKNIETVCLIKPVAGELRTRDIEIIAGEKQTTTVHKEFGLSFIVNVKETYFSPRLANERKRVAESVKPGETIVDMFTGVAPFAVMIAKNSNPKIIYAIDKNKKAIELAEKNAMINKVLEKITLINQDSKDIGKKFKNSIKADRIIMNLPFSSYLFYENALEIAADKCVIHYYEIINEEKISERIDFLRRKAEEKGYKIINAHVNKIKTYAPRQFYIGIDITAKKINADVA
jgi:tRNA (guanine37-N1)-methyltransferase